MFNRLPVGEKPVLRFDYSHSIIGFLDCENAIPPRYWDSVKLVSDNPFYISYIPGSAQYESIKTRKTSWLSDSIITEGAQLEDNELKGALPAGEEGFVTIKVRVYKSAAAKLALTVRKNAGDELKEYIDARIGDEVEFPTE